ncbi:hypothetical protein ACWDRX_33445, partial [Streptomyces nigra]
GRRDGGAVAVQLGLEGLRRRLGLMDLEHARLVLRGEHGLAVDRGRIVREAVAVVLADLESRGDASILVRRLRGR